LRTDAIQQFSVSATHVVLGRPVRFAGAENETDENLALERLRAAAELAGFSDVTFEFEPVAAAYQYETQLDHDELVLIGDFGGGTSDFTLAQLGPGRKRTGKNPVVGTSGVAIAGDTFDSRIMMNLVAPKLGLGSHYVSLGKELPVPVWVFSPTFSLLVIGGFAMQFMVQGAWGVVPVHLNELSPGDVRGTFPGFAYQLGNLFAANTAVVEARLADRFRDASAHPDYAKALAIFVLATSLALIVLAAIGREERGKEF
jgi:hypothetical protein